MARYIGPECKRGRAVGANIANKPKYSRRPFPPGQHGQERKKLSDYGIHLKEKQKVKWTYGLLEKQFYATFLKAVRKKGNTGTIFLQLLESRADNILYKSGLVTSLRQSRQLIVHGHILVNGKKMHSPSYRLVPGDIITIRDGSKALFKQLAETTAVVVPSWLEVDKPNLAIKVIQIPERDQIDQSFKEQLIVEFYSR